MATYIFKPCAARPCSKMGRKWSRYCAAHESRNRRYGEPNGRPIRDKELDAYDSLVGAGLLRYSDRTAVHVAHQLADELLHYRSTHSFTYQFQVEHAMNTLREHGVTAQDVVRRVCAAAAFMRGQPHRFSHIHTEDQFLARAVLRLVCPNKDRNQGRARFHRHLGGLVRDHLMQFASAFLDRLAKDIDDRAELLRNSTDFNTNFTEIPTP